eukprot:Gb_32011 [translate_table: standard]
MAETQMGTLHALLGKIGLGNDTDHLHVVSISLFVTLLCFCIILGHLLEKTRWMNESIAALALLHSLGSNGKWSFLDARDYGSASVTFVHSIRTYVGLQEGSDVTS